MIIILFRFEKFSRYLNTGLNHFFSKTQDQPGQYLDNISNGSCVSQKTRINFGLNDNCVKFYVCLCV